MADPFASLVGKLKSVPAQLERNLSTALRLSGEEAARIAKQTTKFRDRSVVLRNSIEPVGPTGAFLTGDLEVTLSAGAKHASYVEEGTPPHLIRPKYRKALRWGVEGGFAFARLVHHPGTRATRFLEDAADQVIPRLHSVLVPQAIELSFIQAGFDP